jgi:hypothetical protein
MYLHIPVEKKRMRKLIGNQVRSRIYFLRKWIKDFFQSTCRKNENQASNSWGFIPSFHYYNADSSVWEKKGKIKKIWHHWIWILKSKHCFRFFFWLLFLFVLKTYFKAPTVPKLFNLRTEIMGEMKVFVW